MAYLETWDLLGVRVARDLTAYLATRVCPAKRWVLSALWIAVSSSLLLIRPIKCGLLVSRHMLDQHALLVKEIAESRKEESAGTW